MTISHDLLTRIREALSDEVSPPVPEERQDRR